MELHENGGDSPLPSECNGFLEAATDIDDGAIVLEEPDSEPLPT
jgi:hypothetical protein